MIEIVRYTQRNVKRWQTVTCASAGQLPGCSPLSSSFRRIIGYKDLAKLMIAIERHALPIAEKNRDRQETREPVTV